MEHIEYEDCDRKKPWTIRSPANIELLIHIYATPLPLKNEESERATIDDFLKNDLIELDAESKSGYRTTLRGDALVGMLCNTPLPVYKDPRDYLYKYVKTFYGVKTQDTKI